MIIVLQTYSFNSNGIVLNTNESIPFNIVNVNTNCGVSHSSGSTSIEINKSGYYEITFSSFGYNTGAVVEGTDYSGMYAFQLYNKGIPVVNAIASSSSTADTEVENVMFSVILNVLPSCKMVNNNAILTVNYLGQEGTLFGANLTVKKLG